MPVLTLWEAYTEITLMKTPSARQEYNICCCVFLGPHLWHVDVLRLEVKSELQLLAYATATAIRDLSHICDQNHSSRQHQIADPLGEARHGTCILMDANRICFRCTTTGTPIC